MSNLLTLRDFKEKELDPNSTPLEVLTFVTEVALQKLKAKEKAVANPSTEEKVQPLKNNKRKSSHKQFTNKKKRDDRASVLPEEFKRRIIKKCGGTRPNRIICIYRNTLSSLDIEKHYSRLALPLKKMVAVEFLEDKEKALLKQRGAIEVPLIFKGKESSPSEITLNFKFWNVNKQYVLNGGWNEIVKEDRLKKGQTVHVWAFRDTKEKLCMALVKHG